MLQSVTRTISKIEFWTPVKNLSLLKSILKLSNPTNVLLSVYPPHLNIDIRKISIVGRIINTINNIAAGARQQNTNSPFPFLAFINSSPVRIKRAVKTDSPPAYTCDILPVIRTGKFPVIYFLFISALHGI